VGTAAIVVDHVSKSFGTTKALVDVDLEVQQGTVMALLGPNGAGKTTLVRVLTTLLVPDRGRARVAGLDVVRDARRLREVIGFAGQFAAVDDLLTGRENLELVGLWYHLDRATYKRRAELSLERFGLAEAADRVVKTYSGGMRRRLDIAAAMISVPSVLFLDEPTTGLDPKTRNDVWRFVEELVASGTTVLLTTQYMEEADHLAHHILVLDAGVVIAQGSARQLKEQLGGDVLEARVHDGGDLERAVAILAAVGAGRTTRNREQQTAGVPVLGGTADLIEAGRRFQSEGIALDDLGIRRPSLDDVFLTLTGATTGSGGASGAHS
jgi:ABC-2 type transport system ATP-binding protein